MEELQSELVWAAGRPKSLAKGRAVQHLPRQEQCSAMMTPNERKWIDSYGRQRPGCICMGNQNADTSYGVSSKNSPIIYCIIRNPTIHYSHSHHRWLSGRETLLANGIPILPMHADPIAGRPAHCSPSQVYGPSALAGERTRNRLVQGSGNIMHPCIAALLELVFFCGLNGRTKH
mmetsp:Transcript_141292/g.451582  ORF Transcript_141292/g.451582 Transcript_141292/m.451582 type:complete len:175 (-) Transcript_141292:104-628(-)